MQRFQLSLRLVVVVIASMFVAGIGNNRVSAQEVVASYADNAGSIIRYRISDGEQVSRIAQVYRVNGTTFLPTKIAVEDSAFYYVVFGNRYLARLRASDGSFSWVVDAGLTVGYTTYIVADIAAAGGSIFVSNQDPGGRISRFRATDGALLWSVPRAVQVGVLLHLPLKLAAAGGESFFAVLGSQFLCKLSQSNGAVIWQMSVPLTAYPITWGVADLTVGGGFEFISNLDPQGTTRKFNGQGSPVGQFSLLYRIGLIWYVPTKLAAVGSDPVMALFGNRYLARMRTSDAQILWTRDIGLTVGNTTFFPSDIAAVATP